MLNLVKKTTVIAFMFSLVGCLFDSGSDTVVDDYQVGWIDVIESRDLNKKEELVPAYVFAVGYDWRFIFAKQHPLKPNSNEKIDKTIINYYIIERTRNEFQDKPKYGPVTKRVFDSLCIKLGILKVEFDMLYPTDL